MDLQDRPNRASRAILGDEGISNGPPAGVFGLVVRPSASSSARNGRRDGARANLYTNGVNGHADANGRANGVNGRANGINSRANGLNSRATGVSDHAHASDISGHANGVNGQAYPGTAFASLQPRPISIEAITNASWAVNCLPPPYMRPQPVRVQPANGAYESAQPNGATGTDDRDYTASPASSDSIIADVGDMIILPRDPPVPPHVLVILNGWPAVGKTTIADALQAMLSPYQCVMDQRELTGIMP